MGEARSRPAKHSEQSKRIGKTASQSSGLPKFLEIAIAVILGVCFVVVTPVIGALFAGNLGMITPQFLLMFFVTLLSAFLYVLRYYANDIEYGQYGSEKSIPVMIVSMSILVVGALLFVATLIPSVWLPLYDVLLVLSVLKKYQIIRFIERFTDAHKELKMKLKMKLLADRVHEIDTITLEASIGAFVFLSLVVSYLGLQNFVGISGSNNLITVNALLILCYVLLLLVSKLVRYAPQISNRLKGE